MTQAKTAKQQQLLTRWSEALATSTFSQHHLSVDALASALPQARSRSFQRLVQSVFREGLVDGKQCEYCPDGSCWLTLNDGARLQFDYLSPEGMGSWDLKGNISAYRPAHSAYLIEFPSELLELLTPLFCSPVSVKAFERLSSELDDSFINDTLCLAFHDSWSRRLQRQIDDDKAVNLLAWIKTQPVSINPTLLLEQWGTLGHPSHPNYKTKPGLSTSQIIGFSPEFGASFSVVLCALHHQYAHVEAIPGTPNHWTWWFKFFPHAAEKLTIELTRQGLEATQYVPVPVHPWQAREQLPTMFSQEIGDRLLVLTDVVAFIGHPTMSFRTVVPNASNSAPMVKLPVAMRLTSVQRTLSPRSVRMGPRISQLLQQILDGEPQLRQVLSIVPERAGFHFQSKGTHDDRARHLAALYRDNPQSLIDSGELAVPVGSLFALDAKGQPLLRQWVALAQGRDDGAALLCFLRDYLAVSVPGLLGMYLLYGVAFEAHQQNSFMVMGADGQPARLLLRDFGDIRIHRNTLQASGLDINLYDPAMTLHDDANHVRDKLLHATFICHLGELVLLCARHWDVPQNLLWNELALQVSECFEALRERVEPLRWETERRALLEQDWPAKSFTRMRLMDSQTDIVGRLNNPLHKRAHEG